MIGIIFASVLLQLGSESGIFAAIALKALETNLEDPNSSNIEVDQSIMYKRSSKHNLQRAEPQT